jgi:hypothetical protein
MRTTIAQVIAPATRTVREIYTSDIANPVRVAALVEISASAAALARTIVRFHHLDPNLIRPHVRDAVDLRAVLGRGRWLPTMTQSVPAPPPSGRPQLSRSVRRRIARKGL